jgi:hypothetical protein
MGLIKLSPRARTITEAVLAAITLAISLSPTQLTNRNLVEFVKNALAD